MEKIAKQLTELIGGTPLLELSNYEKKNSLGAQIVAKLEYFNPLGSVKDRVANAMIEQGIKDGKINQDTVIIEPTSGNTGIGLAFVTASKGLHLILTMPDTMSMERRKIVKSRRNSTKKSLSKTRWKISKNLIARRIPTDETYTFRKWKALCPGTIFCLSTTSIPAGKTAAEKGKSPQIFLPKSATM